MAGRYSKPAFLRGGRLRAVAVIAVAAVALVAAAAPASRRLKNAASGPLQWKLRFTENFNGPKLNGKLWKRVESGESDWNRNMSLRADLVDIKDGAVRLFGVKNSDLADDPRPVLTGGISTRGTFNMKYGKVEIRARLEANKGAWPAIWMMPQTPGAPWPKCGEIDIIERLNFDPFVYHTVHSEWTKTPGNAPASGGRGKIQPDDWNIYALEWTPTKLVWKVNGTVTHSYPKLADDDSKWPWDKPFYLIIDMQLGGKWVGGVDESTLPVVMYVDWVKFYDLVRGTQKISEYSRPRR